MSVVVGVGLSSKATSEEVAWLVADALSVVGMTIDDVSAVATRSQLAGDERLRLGPPVTGFDDDVLVAATAPVHRAVGIPARVAETAATLAVGPGAACSLHKSAHVTVAVAVGVER